MVLDVAGVATSPAVGLDHLRLLGLHPLLLAPGTGIQTFQNQPEISSFGTGVLVLVYHIAIMK